MHAVSIDGGAEMSNEEKAEKYDQIAEALWNMAAGGNLLQSTIAAAMIRQLEIHGPDGEDPESA